MSEELPEDQADFCLIQFLNKSPKGTRRETYGRRAWGPLVLLAGLERRTVGVAKSLQKGRYGEPKQHSR